MIMKKLNYFKMAAMAAAVSLTACNNDDDNNVTDNNNGSSVVAEANTEMPADYDFGVERTIQYNASSVAVNHSAVTVNGGTATITQAGTYRISGNSTDAHIVVDAGANDNVRIILDGVTLSNNYAPVLEAKNAYKVILRAEPGTQSTLADGTGNGGSATISSNTKLSIFGTGKLTVTGNDTDAIYSKGGVILKETDLVLNAKGDGVETDYNVDVLSGTITANTDGSVINATTVTRVNGGELSFMGKQNGIETGVYTQSGGRLLISGNGNGIVASSTGTSAAPVTVSDGYLYINVPQNGIESSGSIVTSGGTVIVAGNTASGKMAVKHAGAFDVSGGTLFVAGPTSGLSSTSTQNVITVNYPATMAANTLMSLQNTALENLMVVRPDYEYNSITVSSDQIKDGGIYRIFTGGQAGGTLENCMYTPLTGYTGGQLAATFTIQNKVTVVNAE